MTATGHMPPPPLVSVVVPTRNEARNIEPCLRAFDAAAAAGWCETLVVDNASDDHTAELAARCGARVFRQGPERSAQRNRGWREARGAFVFFLDADMRVPAATLDEIRARLAADDPPDALYVREVRVGGGWWIRMRNFERSFYDATCIDALRVIRRSLLEEAGGYDEALYACEDWDLDRRLLARATRVALTDTALEHDEGAFRLRRHLRKKAYYAGSFDAYFKKWGRDAVTRRQFGLWYRFAGVFLEHGKWRRACRHPLLMAAIGFDRALVGAVCLLERARRPRRGGECA